MYNKGLGEYVKGFTPLKEGPMLHFTGECLEGISTLEPHHGKESLYVTQVSPIVERIVMEQKGKVKDTSPMLQLKHCIMPNGIIATLKYKLEMQALASTGLSKDNLTKQGVAVVGNTVVDFNNKESKWVTLEADSFNDKYDTYLTALPLLGDPSGKGYDIHRVLCVGGKVIDIANFIQTQSCFNEDERLVIQAFITHCDTADREQQEATMMKQTEMKEGFGGNETI
jgi:hypothetical protein